MKQKKKITKKEIERVLRTLDSTQIFRMFHRIHGVIPSRMDVYYFIQNNAPSMRVYRSAYRIAFNPKNQDRRILIERECILRHGLYQGDARKWVVDYLKEQCQNPSSNYAKRPMMGHTHLYFCSPVYGHRDYNKRRALPIEGNERFCQLVIKYADKYFK